MKSLKICLVGIFILSTFAFLSKVNFAKELEGVTVPGTAGKETKVEQKLDQEIEILQGRLDQCKGQVSSLDKQESQEEKILEELNKTLASQGLASSGRKGYLKDAIKDQQTKVDELLKRTELKNKECLQRKNELNNLKNKLSPGGGGGLSASSIGTVTLNVPSKITQGQSVKGSWSVTGDLVKCRVYFAGAEGGSKTTFDKSGKSNQSFSTAGVKAGSYEYAVRCFNQSELDQGAMRDLGTSLGKRDSKQVKIELPASASGIASGPSGQTGTSASGGQNAGGSVPQSPAPSGEAPAATGAENSGTKVKQLDILSPLPSQDGKPPTFKRGDTVEIRWESDGVQCRVYFEGAADNKKLALGLKKSGSYKFKIPEDKPAGDYGFSIRCFAEKVSNENMKDSNFVPASSKKVERYVRVVEAAATVVTVPEGDKSAVSLSCRSPQGGESWAIGSEYPVRWSFKIAPHKQIDGIVLMTADKRIIYEDKPKSDSAISHYLEIPKDITPGLYYVGLKYGERTLICGDETKPIKLVKLATSVAHREAKVKFTFLSPNSGSKWPLSTSHSIKWNTNIDLQVMQASFSLSTKEPTLLSGLALKSPAEWKVALPEGQKPGEYQISLELGVTDQLYTSRVFKILPAYAAKYTCYCGGHKNEKKYKLVEGKEDGKKCAEIDLSKICQKRCPAAYVWNSDRSKCEDVTISDAQSSSADARQSLLGKIGAIFGLGR
jgi:hypothetical protein